MKPGTLHTVVYWGAMSFEFLASFLLVAAVCEPAMIHVNHSTTLGFRAWTQQNLNAIGIVLSAAIFVFRSIRAFVGPPWLWITISEILREFHTAVFSELGEWEFANHHRVTLYRYRRFVLWPTGRGRWPFSGGRFPWSGWLVPVLRAGPESPGSTVWCAHETKYDGFCGAVFRMQAGTAEKGPPGLPDISQDSTEGEIEEYARNTFVDPITIRNRIARGKPCARYYLAIRILVDSRKRWGVLMIDSREEKLPRAQVATHRFDQVCEVLSHLLKRVS